VVETLIEKGLKAVPVVEEGQLRGIITGGDLLARSGMGLRLSLQRTLPPHVFAEQIRQLDAEGKTAKDIMSSPVITVSEDDHITNAVALMTEKGIKRIPVVNHQGELVGILSRLDILALVSSSSPSADFFPSASGASARTAGDVMFRDVPTVDPECPLNDVVTQILSTPLRRVVVVDEEHHILGIIVDRDLVKAFPHGKTGGLTNILSHLSSKPQGILNLTGSAADVMNKDVFSVRPDTPLAAVVQTMIDKRIKRLTVADEDNRLVGMVSRESILHTFG
jgi:CBS domain-containing protein